MPSNDSTSVMAMLLTYEMVVGMEDFNDGW